MNPTNLSDGNTDSERYLIRLAKLAFLSLWSYPNLYTDEGKSGVGDGKELCDLLIVFGNDVIIFSDKNCQFTKHEDNEVVWTRWYKRAIEKSAKQLAGAESWIRKFPSRIFLDAACTQPFPINIPAADEINIHLIAVTRGSAKQAEKYWEGNSSASLFIDTSLIDKAHYKSPFKVGWVNGKNKYVHVFDEITLDIVLKELDTIYDFVSYLKAKEELLHAKGIDLAVPGEEELLALYLSNFDQKKQSHLFPQLPPNCLLALREGDWVKLCNSNAYKAREKANQISHIWDELIEYQNWFIISGNSKVISESKNATSQEKLMRIMASESRLTRRSLGESFLTANKNETKESRFTRIILSTSKSSLAYVFLSLPHPDDLELEDYLEMRRYDIQLYAFGAKLKFEYINEIIGIVFEPNKNEFGLIDYFYLNFNNEKIDEKFASFLREQLIKEKMWQDSAITTKIIHNIPFPPHLSKLRKTQVSLTNLFKNIMKNFKS